MKQELSRRDFLKLGGALAFSTFSGSNCSPQNDGQKPEPQFSPELALESFTLDDISTKVIPEVMRRAQNFPELILNVPNLDYLVKNNIPPQSVPNIAVSQQVLLDKYAIEKVFFIRQPRQNAISFEVDFQQGPKPIDEKPKVPALAFSIADELSNTITADVTRYIERGSDKLSFAFFFPYLEPVFENGNFYVVIGSSLVNIDGKNLPPLVMPYKFLLENTSPIA